MGVIPLGLPRFAGIVLYFKYPAACGGVLYLIAHFIFKYFFQAQPVNFGIVPDVDGKVMMEQKGLNGLKEWKFFRKCFYRLDKLRMRQATLFFGFNNDCRDVLAPFAQTD